MVAAGCPLPPTEIVPYILANLGNEYDALTSSVTTRLDLISLDDLLGHLLAHEAHMLHHSDAHIFNNDTSTHFTTKFPFAQRSRGSHGGRNNSHSYGGGRYNSHCGQGSFSSNNGNTFPTLTNNSLICQVCNQQGHFALTCIYRFN